MIKILLKESKRNNVICHITGRSGSGKTTLLLKIKELFPMVKILDLDLLDEASDRKYDLPTGWKSSDLYSDDLLEKIHAYRQLLLDKFISKNKNIVLAGHHVEDFTVYNFNATKRFTLNTPSKIIKKQRMKRDGMSSEDYDTSYEDENFIDGLEGYVKATPVEIIEYIKGYLNV